LAIRAQSKCQRSIKESNVLLLWQERPIFKQKCPRKDKQSREEWAVKKAMMHAQAKLEKESKEKEDDDNTSQALQRSSKSKTKMEWMKLITKKESLHNNGKQWEVASYCILDPC
jgi:hypothetical protein